MNHAAALYRQVHRRLRRASAPVGTVRFGDLRRLTPLSRHFGYDRGQPIDRYYIERFLERNAACVHGHVLEIGDDSYTRRFGGDKVLASDVLHISSGNPQATIVADLSHAPQIPDKRFDCVILTQTLHLIFDLPATIQTLQRILRPGGVLLATVPGISQISRDVWCASWYWAFTDQSVRRLFGTAFPLASLEVATHGNVLAAAAFLYGLSSRELRPAELEHVDPHYQLVITIRAEKPPET